MTMTREEARRVLRDYVLSAYVTDAEREAIRQADAALSAQEPAPPAQAEPLRVTREQLADAWQAGVSCGSHWDENNMLAALHQLGAKVEVSDG